MPEKGEKSTGPVRFRFSMSLFGVICVLVSGIYLLSISLPWLLRLSKGSINIEDLIIHVLLFGIGSVTVFTGMRMLREGVLYQHLIDTTFETEIYTRLEPIISEIARTNARMESMEVNFRNSNSPARVGGTIDDRSTSVSYLANSLNSFFLYVVVLNVTVAVVFFVLRYPYGYVPYLMVVLFIAWWAAISAEFDMWEVGESWAWAFFSVIVVPIVTILLGQILALWSLFGLLCIGLFIYAIGYRMWAKFYTTGYFPIGLSPQLLPSSKTQESEIDDS